MSPTDDPVAKALANHLGRARFFLTGSQWARGAEASRQILSLDPNHAEGHAVLAICLARLGETAQARREAELALAIDSHDKYYFYASAVAARADGDLERAEADARRGLSLDSECAYLHFELYGIYRAQKRWPEAKAYVRYALHLAPLKVNYHLEMARTHYAMSELEDGDREIKETLRLDPDNAEAQKFLGPRQLEARQLATAASTLRSSLSLNPHDETSQRQLRLAEKKLSWFFAPYRRVEEQFSGSWNWARFVSFTPLVGFMILGWTDDNRKSPDIATPAILQIVPYLAFSAMTILAVYMFIADEMLWVHVAKASPVNRIAARVFIIALSLMLHIAYWAS